MRRLIWVWTLCLWMLGLGGSVAQIGTDISSLKVASVSIRHVGPPATSDDFIRAQIRLKPGDPYTPAASDEDIRTLYATGLFYDIRVTENMTDDGVEVTYVLQGKPRLTDIRIQGNSRISEKKIRDKIKSKVGEPLDDRKLFTDKQEIEKLYEKKGYTGTTVKSVTSIVQATGRGTATFEIHEAPKIKIAAIKFDGATAFPQHVSWFEKLLHPSRKGLDHVIKTRRRWWLSWLTGSGRFKEDQFEDDKMSLEDFYLQKGYLDFQIKDVKFEHPEPNKMVIRFKVEEGTPYKVGSVDFEGATMLSTNAEQASHTLTESQGKPLSLLPGATFTPGDLQKDTQLIEDFYGSKGYIDVNTTSGNLEVTHFPNIEAGTIDLKYHVKEGQKSYIEKIEIRGNTKTRDKVIRRELAVSPGEVFDTVGMKISKARLEGLQFFEKVDVRPESTTIPNRKNLVVAVDEKNTGNVSLGAGFSTVDSLVGFVEYTQGNFDLANPPSFQGGGQKLRLRLQLGTSRQDYTLQFVEPWFLGRKLEFDFDLYYRELGYQSLEGLYDEVRGGARVGFVRPLWSDFFRGGISYSLENVGIINVDRDAPPSIASEKGYSLLSKLSASISYDTRRGIGLPNHGQKTELVGTMVGGPIGGAKDFYKLELRTAWYFPGPFEGHVLEMVGRAGVTDGFAGDTDVPFYERYYLGGLTTLRGFEYRGVGPREQVGTTGRYEPVGGKSYWFGSVEYSIPIIERLRLAAFYDIGNLVENSYDFHTGHFSDNWGVGVRINLPIGPLRLDYAIPINYDSRYNSGGGRFQFSVGNTRPE